MRFELKKMRFELKKKFTSYERTYELTKNLHNISKGNPESTVSAEWGIEPFHDFQLHVSLIRYYCDIP